MYVLLCTEDQCQFKYEGTCDRPKVCRDDCDGENKPICAGPERDDNPALRQNFNGYCELQTFNCHRNWSKYTLLSIYTHFRSEFSR